MSIIEADDGNICRRARHLLFFRDVNTVVSYRFSLPAIESINRVCFNLRDWSHLTNRAMLVRTKRISISPDVKGRTTGSWLAAGNGLEMGRMTSQMPCQDTAVEGKTYLFSFSIHYPFIFILFSHFQCIPLIIKLDSNLIWGWVKTLVPSEPQNSWDLWMFIPLKMVLIGIDPSPYCASIFAKQTIQIIHRWTISGRVHRRFGPDWRSGPGSGGRNGGFRRDLIATSRENYGLNFFSIYAELCRWNTVQLLQPYTVGIQKD